MPFIFSNLWKNSRQKCLVKNETALYVFKILVKIADHASKIQFYQPKVRLSPITRASLHDLSFLEIHLFTSRHVHSIPPPGNYHEHTRLCPPRRSPPQRSVSAQNVERRSPGKSKRFLDGLARRCPLFLPRRSRVSFPRQPPKETEIRRKRSPVHFFRASHARWNTS